MVLHNPNNWHWVNKDVREWSREYLDKTIVGTEASESDKSVKISRIASMEGDMDVSQRKGKVITLFDVKLVLDYEGNVEEDEDFTGTITIPEVAHDTEEDEYVFEISIIDETTSKAAIKPLIRSKMIPQLRTLLARLAPTLIKEHGKDLQHATGADPTLQPTKVTSSSNLSQSKGQQSTQKSSNTSTTSSAGQSSINTTTLTETDEFRTTAAELFQTFTDPQRLSAFTRAAPQLFEGAHPGGKFRLFGGNISGEYEELKEPTLIVQKWRLGTWVEGHYSKLVIRFDQNEADHVTLMRVEWSGVPVGEEEVVKRNWGEYYVRSIKTTFGFGTVL